MAEPVHEALHGSHVELLAEVDEAHERVSGRATRRILQRKLEHYQRYKSLAGSRRPISIGGN